MRPSGRRPDEMPHVQLTPHFPRHAEGSVLAAFGDTQVVCTASVEAKVPQFLKGKAQGWVTAEYGMLPRATHTRTQRGAARGRPDGAAARAGDRGGYAALVLAATELVKSGQIVRDPIHGQVAAVSVG